MISARFLRNLLFFSVSNLEWFIDGVLASYFCTFPGYRFLHAFEHILVNLWLPFGILVLPFWSSGAAFGSIWLTFGTLWSPPTFLWHASGSILVTLLPFGSLRAPFRLRFGRFS